jgi:hypothetical protein
MEVCGNTGGEFVSFRQGLQCVRYAELSLIGEGTVVCVGEVISWWYYHLMQQLNALTIPNITVTSLRHVSTWQCHLQGIHKKLKATTADRMISVNFVTTPVSIWNVLKVMKFTDTIRCALVVLSFLRIPWRWHCHDEKRRSEVTVLLGFVRAVSWYTEWKYWFKMPKVNNFEILFILNFRHVLNVVFFLGGDSPASEFYMPTFWNTLSVPTS